MYGRQRECASFWIIGAIHPDAALFGLVKDALINIDIACCRDHQSETFNIAGRVFTAKNSNIEPLKFLGHQWCEHRDIGIARKQLLNFAMGDTTTTDYKHRAVSQIQVDRKLHVSPRRWRAGLASTSLFP
jgi:hypothetical protein